MNKTIINPLFYNPFIHLSIHSSVHSSIHSSVHSSIHSFIHPFIHPFIRRAGHALFHSVGLPLFEDMAHRARLPTQPLRHAPHPHAGLLPFPLFSSFPLPSFFSFFPYSLLPLSLSFSLFTPLLFFLFFLFLFFLFLFLFFLLFLLFLLLPLFFLLSHFPSILF